VCGFEFPGLRRLHPLPYMLDKGRLASKYPPTIREVVRSWCARVSAITERPTPELLERLAKEEGIDGGEALLYGLLAERPSWKLLSNDKVAMRALRNSQDLSDIYASCCGRVVCLESAVRALLLRHGLDTVTEALIPLRIYDGMLRAVFSMGRETSLETAWKAWVHTFRNFLARSVFAFFSTLISQQASQDRLPVRAFVDNLARNARRQVLCRAA
jgi:hypothetical protein